MKKIFINGRLKKLIILFLLEAVFFIYNTYFVLKKNNGSHNGIFNKTMLINNTYNKWIVITTFNPPSSSIINLEKIIDDWKIVVIGNNETNEIKWNIFKFSTKLFYLSLYEQNYLNYNITNYLNPNSYYRKSIGYLYAIQHGAKEIYEIDEDIEINDTSYLDSNFENVYVSYVNRNDSLMINPYSYFGEANIWPRGFRINDIGKQIKNDLGLVNSSNIDLRPLIFQGLINNIPDIDSIFHLTRKKFKYAFNFNSPKIYPLIYFPNNYVPINSKNTRYLYDIFPFLMFPISYDENIGDIWRGYIIQYFAWRFNGYVIFFSPEVKRVTDHKCFNDLKAEKSNFFGLDRFLDILNSNFKIDSNKHILENFINFIEMLYNNKIIKNKDIIIIKAFLLDIINIGYKFSYDFFKDTKKLYFDYLKINSNFEIYIPSKNIIVKNDNFKLINHISSNHIYRDILLIINYNRKGFLYLNKYIIKIYKKYFPHIVFIYPSITEKKNTFSCKYSHNGFYSYKCLKKIYLKYPNYKGYLYINDDLFLKVWELSNLNFDVPWLNQFGRLNRKWPHYKRCFPLYNLMNKNNFWKNNIIKINGYFDILAGLSDFYYIPNNYTSTLFNLFDKMFESKAFLECSVPTSMSILLSPKYQIIYIDALWGKDRRNAINFLHIRYDQIVIHPVKLSKQETRRKIDQYLYFINSNEY